MDTMKLTRVGLSNLTTMNACAPHEPRQAVGEPYVMPDVDVRRLRAKLIFDEAMETIRALGFLTSVKLAGEMGYISVGKWEDLVAEAELPPDMEESIDGCCDLIYVATGCLLAMGVHDAPHLKHVCECNEAKLVDGKPIISATGRFEKPAGWKAPNHRQLALETGLLAEDYSTKVHSHQGVQDAIEGTLKDMEDYFNQQRARGLAGLEKSAVAKFARDLINRLKRM